MICTMRIIREPSATDASSADQIDILYVKMNLDWYPTSDPSLSTHRLRCRIAARTVYRPKFTAPFGG